MWPLRTVTDPNRRRYARACVASAVAHPHSGYTAHRGTCVKTTIGALEPSLETSFSSHIEDALGAQALEVLGHGIKGARLLGVPEVTGVDDESRRLSERVETRDAWRGGI